MYCALIPKSSRATDGMENQCQFGNGVRLLFWSVLCFSIFGIFLTNVFQLQYYEVQTTDKSDPNVENALINKQLLQGFLIRTPGCRIPHMDPFDAKIRQFIEKPERPVCNNGRPPLVDSNATSIFLVKSSIKFYANGTKFKCCYTPFKRKDPAPEEDDFVFKFGTKCVQIRNSVEIHDEFIQVTCRTKNATTFYTDFFSFVPAKKPQVQPQKAALNVLIIGIDAVSRLNFHRQMPNTVDFLLKNLSAVELLGFNKVGDNTFPNLIPLLTGYDEYQLQRVCWKTNAEERFDECPFIWKEYAKRGYVTALAEDTSWMGIFNYLRRGFKKQPTDYTWGPFNRLAEQEIGNSHNLNVQECVGSREVYKVFIDYIKRFTAQMEKPTRKPYFGFFWGASLTHDYLNKANLGDADYMDLLKHLQNYQNNTVMILLSDHGIRWGGIRQTYQGRMEERLPFVYITLPEWFKRQYSAAFVNLLKNTRRLTTPFDLHETLIDLLDPSNMSKSEHEGYQRGFSLFGEISEKRRCEDADIAAHWCTCQQSIDIDTNNSVVLESAQYAVDFINNDLLKGYRDCAVLSLANVTSAQIMTHDEEVFTSGNDVKDYTITLQTYPGDGIFEVTVRRSQNRDVEEPENTYHNEIMGTISRLNLYGRQSVCITDFHLKLYCYCK